MIAARRDAPHGGDCVNTGCVPSKALIRSAKLLSHIARSRDVGIAEASARFGLPRRPARPYRVRNPLRRE